MKVIRAILFVINVLLAFGLLLTTLAGTVAPSRAILPSVLAYGYLPLLAANVVMILLWLLLRRWTWLLSAAVIALRWGTLGFFFQVGGTTKVPDASEHPYAVSLMTYNVHQFQGPDNRPEQSDSNASVFLSLVRRHQPDVLCMQEYAAPKRLALTDSLVLLGYNHYYGAHTARNGTPYGTVVFSRLPITYVTRIDSEKLLVELLKESSSGGPAQRFRVCCIHMDSYRFNDADREEIERMRRGEVQESSRRTLGKVKETILCHENEWTQRIKPVVTDSSVPMVLAGDLNDIPGSWLYRQIGKELRDTFRDKGFGYSHTYNGGFPQFRIDMLFHNEGLDCLSYRRIKSDMSDHYPVLTYLEFAI